MRCPSPAERLHPSLLAGASSAMLQVSLTSCLHTTLLVGKVTRGNAGKKVELHTLDQCSASHPPPSPFPLPLSIARSCCSPHIPCGSTHGTLPCGSLSQHSPQHGLAGFLLEQGLHRELSNLGMGTEFRYSFRV